MKRYIAEIVATFFMIFCGTGAMIIDTESQGVISHLGVATVWGLIVMVMIFSFGKISGAHMNPAVTLTLVLLKKHSRKDLLPYFLSQLIGAFSASITLKLIFPENEFLGSTLPSGSDYQSFVLEFILTFILMIVILLTTQGKKEIEQHFAPIAIGMTIMLGALFAGPISKASMNPFRSLAPAVTSGHIEHLWLYIVATTLGALAAGLYWLWQDS